MQADLDIHRTAIKHKKQSQLSQTFRIALQQFVSRPVADLLTMLVLAVILALPISLFWLLTNMPTVFQSWDYSPKIALYLKADVTAMQAQTLLKQIEKREDVAKAIYISPEQGLKDLAQQTQINVADKLANNPLPGVIEILPKGLPSTTQIAQFAGDFKALTQVEHVQFNKELMEQRYQWLEFAWQLFYFFADLFAVIAVVLIAKQLQLGFRDSFGALFINGVFFGLGGGLFAWLILVFGLSDIASAIPVWTSQFSALSNDLVGKFLFLSMGLGVVGATLASALLLIHPLGSKQSNSEAIYA